MIPFGESRTFRMSNNGVETLFHRNIKRTANGHFELVDLTSAQRVTFAGQWASNTFSTFFAATCALYLVGGDV